MKKSVTAAITMSDLVTDPDTGEVIRRDTGEVVANVVPQDKEWRAASSAEASARAHNGVPTSLAFHDMGLSTVIGKNDVDAAGNYLDASTRARMGRLRIWNTRSQRRSSSERNLQQAFTMLAKIKHTLNLPDYVTEKAAYVYRKAQERGLIRGSSTGSVLAASIYIASRQSGILRTLEDISETTNVKPKQAARSYRRVVSALEMSVPMIDPARYIIRVANGLALDEKATRRALELMKTAKNRNALVGKDPVGIAASILYLVSLDEPKTPRTQTEIAKAAGVTEVTLRTRSKELRRILKDLI